MTGDAGSAGGKSPRNEVSGDIAGEVLRGTLEATAEGILVVGDDGVVITANKRFAEMWRIPPDLLEARDDEKLLDFVVAQLEDPDTFLRKVRELYGSNETSLDVLKFRNGQIVERSSSPLVMDGKTSGRVWSFRDITDREKVQRERLRLEREVQHRQKLESLGVLAGGIAHDFNNLLVGVLGSADLARSVLPDHSPARQHVDSIATAAQSAAELCNQMLAYSGKGRFIVRPVHLSEVVEEMSRLLSVSISKSVRLQKKLAQSLPAIEADVAQLRRIVMNLITNASEAVESRGGTITLPACRIARRASYEART